MTHPGKEPGMTGFPTPNEIPLDSAYLVFIFPNDEAFPQLILGALKPLSFSYNFYQWGDITPDEASEKFREIIEEAPYNLREEGVPAPYWDNAEDVDDEEPNSIQQWFGEMQGLDFVPQVGIIAITGFLMYSGQIGAAIKFVTFAPSFALAWKKDGVGGAIRVFVDEVDMGLLDTEGDPSEIIEKTFIGDPDLGSHVILQILEALPIGARHVLDQETTHALTGRATKHPGKSRNRGSRNVDGWGGNLGPKPISGPAT